MKSSAPSAASKVRQKELTASKMGSLASETCTSCLLSARSRRVFGVRDAFGLAVAGLSVGAHLAGGIAMLGHVSRVSVAALVGRLGLQGGFSIFASVRGHVILAAVSVVEGRRARIRSSRFGTDSPRSYAAAPVRRCHLDPVPGALEGTKSGLDCSSSSAVEIAFVPRAGASVEGCVANSPKQHSLFGDGPGGGGGT